jgi:hypothetical protein
MMLFEKMTVGTLLLGAFVFATAAEAGITMDTAVHRLARDQYSATDHTRFLQDEQSQGDSALSPQDGGESESVATTEPQNTSSMYPLGTDVWWKFDDVWYVDVDTYGMLGCHIVHEERIFCLHKVMLRRPFSRLVLHSLLTGKITLSIFFNIRYEGTIIDFDESVPNYSVKWEDDEIIVYTDMQQVDQMVQNAYLDDDDVYTDLTTYQSWPKGTPVLLEFASGWYEGQITTYELINSTYAWYQIDWSDGTSGQYDDLDLVDEMVQNAEEYDPWTVGTAVYNANGELDEDVEANLEGTIQSFEDGAYTIEWSNGQLRDYYDFDDVDDLVAAAVRKNGPTADVDGDDAYEPWAIGTEVWYEFDDGWWQGTITDYDAAEKTYDITWSDGSVDTYYDLDKVDQMVYDAQDNTEEATDYYDDSFQDYEIGTFVYKEFDDGWWVGNIVAYENGSYTVRWTDNTFDNFDADSQELAEIVDNADNIPDDFDVQIYPIGTPVYLEFDDGNWYHGTIESYQESMYTVEWEDGTSTRHVTGREMDAMVAAGVPPSRMSGAGIATLSIFILMISLGLAFYIVKVVERRRTINATVRASVQEVEELDKQHNGYAA